MSPLIGAAAAAGQEDVLLLSPPGLDLPAQAGLRSPFAALATVDHEQSRPAKPAFKPQPLQTPMQTPKGAAPVPIGARSPHHMVVEADTTIARMVPVNPEPQRPCKEVREAQASADFVPLYVVCINPLCRRKWKQLTAKALPVFCPPCKRQLEEGLPDLQQLSEVELLRRTYARWHEIWSELQQALAWNGEVPQAADLAHSTTEEIVAVFQSAFPAPPRAEDVRNWNSVHGRRKHYRGVVRRDARWRFVCFVEAREELEEDLKSARRVPQGVKEFPLVDWQQQCVEGQEVHFVAFPNPSVTEREVVSRIVRLLQRDEEVVAPSGEAQGAPLAMSAFDDLVRWSCQDEQLEPARAAPEESAAPRVHLSLETALQLEQPKPKSGAARAKAPRAPRESAPAPAPAPAPVPPPMAGRPNGGASQKSPAFKAPSFMGRSPLICPRSPFAAYFDD